VKGIIEAHGGIIREIGDLNASKGRREGAHFIVLLPINSGIEAEKKESENATVGSVDDSQPKE
jgi:hypothetical protein